MIEDTKRRNTRFQIIIFIRVFFAQGIEWALPQHKYVGIDHVIESYFQNENVILIITSYSGVSLIYILLHIKRYLIRPILKFWVKNGGLCQSLCLG